MPAIFTPFDRRRCDAIRAAHASIENRLALAALALLALGVPLTHALGWWAS